jgi:FixJ family two-component response regulator
MTGRALAKRLGELRPDLPVVLTSGHMAEGSDPAGTWDHSHPFLRKPFTPGELLRFVRSELDR